MRHPKTFLMMLLVSFTYGAPTTARANCDPELIARADSGVLGYQIREGDTRCEGFLGEPTRQENLELLSLVRGELQYNAGRHQVLRIAAPDLSAVTDEPVRVQAFSLYEGYHYRMDAVLPRGRPMIWPIRSVLVPAGLSPDQIGIYGMVGKDAYRKFVPVSITANHADVDLAVPVRITLRTPADLKRMEWRFAGEDLNWSPWQEIPRSGISAGQWKTWELPDVPSGVLRVQVQGHRVFHEKAVWLNAPDGVQILRRNP